MSRFVDARIPVVFGPAERGDAALVEGDAEVPVGTPVARFVLPAEAPGETTAHPAGCACCQGRGPVATALHALFLARARGTVAFFARVAVQASGAGSAAVRAELAEDPLLAAWFRPG